jgi:hypothetical protein
MPPSLRHIRTYATFASWTSQFYEKTWVVHLNRQTDNRKATIEYLGKYLKRPPIGETRIKAYDGKTVTYEYLDHHTGTMELMTLPVLEFIARLIAHIPDQNFRMIRYYGFLSTRNRGKLLPLVYKLLEMKNVVVKKVYTFWRTMIRKFFGRDPIRCPNCKTVMQLDHVVPPYGGKLIRYHREIANGAYPLLQ